MNKTILFGLLWWSLVFIEVSFIGFTPGLATQGENGFILLPKGIAIHFMILAILSALFGKLYFRKTTFESKNAITTAALIVFIGFLLDAIITVPFFVKSYSLYFTKWTLWIGVGIFLFVFYFIGKFQKKYN